MNNLFKIQLIDSDSIPDLLKLIKWPPYGLPLATANSVLKAKVGRLNWGYFEVVPA